ncbi:PI-actitoxin-Afv2b-like [Rhagoletis pomonella]|uniref:PI-actitoxin-Afv2b-like n=1 Tax=Rhagoletis pomonella TaxID=28610 RepID=UPI0017861062|nr:PI-actitoxin-Afv2b-like [Rhagoletis pomonella]
MKCVVYLLALTLAFLFFEQTLAQCPNAPRIRSCRAAVDSGSGGPGCIPGVRWYYNRQSRSCISFRYIGCGGNANRYCSLAACQKRCVPRP